MGVDTGADAMVAGAERLRVQPGRARSTSPRPARSNFPTDFEHNLPALAQSAIGQFEVAATPLQMALVAGAVANDGVIMAPHVLRDVRDADGDVVDTYEPEDVWTTAMDRGTAALHARGHASASSTHGTADPARSARASTSAARRAPPSSAPTRPARTRGSSASAAPPAASPSIAVAVIVEGQPGASEQTGGRVAAPIAQAVTRGVPDGLRPVP